MSEDRSIEKAATRKAFVLIALVMVGVLAGFIVATDDGQLDTLAHCVTTGSFRHVPADLGAFEHEFRGLKYKGDPDNVIDFHVYAFGWYELHVLTAMRDLMAAKAGEGKGVYLDVGANVGTHVLFIAPHASHVHAIEPWPTILDRLAEHIDLNGLKNVTIHPVGYSDSQGELPFHVPPDYNLGFGSFSKSFADPKFEGGERVIQLPLVRGDDHLSGAGVERIDLVKIDIEGYERPAFEGLAETLRRDRPVAVFELNVVNEEGIHSEEELRGTFPKNYDFFEIVPRKDWLLDLPGGGTVACGNDDGAYRLEPFDMRFDVDSRNLVAVPAELTSTITLEYWP